MKLRRPDRRGSFLVAFGVLYTLIGVSYLTAPPLPAAVKHLYLALRVLPLWAWGILWIVCGVAGAVVAVVDHVRFRRFDFVGAVLAPLLWGGTYILGQFTGDASQGRIAAAVYIALAVAVYIVSGLVDPADVIRRRPPRDN